MVFGAPSWAPKVPPDAIPDSIPLCDFLLDEKHGRAPYDSSKAPFIWGTSAAGYTAVETRQRVEGLARGLSQQLGWYPNGGSEWEKIVAVFAPNHIDHMPLGWAVHRLSGIVCLINAASTADELTYQLQASKSSVLFTSGPVLETALEAAAKCGIPRSRVFLLDIPQDLLSGSKSPTEFTSVDQIINRGSGLGNLEPLKWEKGQGAKQCAYLCFSSGTSGLPKGVMLSHLNMIAEVFLVKQFDSFTRTKGQRDVVLGLLPQSHLFGLSVFNAAVYQGDSVVVPPIVIAMVKNAELMNKYDLSSVRSLITGAAPLGAETAEHLSRLQPSWSVLQAYGGTLTLRFISTSEIKLTDGITGLTETTAVATYTSSHDIFFGSSGSLIPSLEARLVSPSGDEIEEYDTPGELLIKGPTVVLGYLNNDAANKETFQGGWLRTGDEAMFRKSAKGEDHVFIVDRIKELIKVKVRLFIPTYPAFSARRVSDNIIKGFQVAPAELEAHILTHPHVADTAVIAVPDDASGESPKAYVVKASDAPADDKALIRDIQRHVEDHKAHYKWLRGGVEFIDVIPKSPSGKILRRYLRDRDREARRRRGSKL
ncbi:hypothetical protein FQN50_000378 [Emmonsiellopsis sp. PD_5]|nr:hypothetical protein FQN50_000378 [Emmonsiellopsis sp. PD_5]